MNSLIQRALGEDWQRLPPALQAHYGPSVSGTTVDAGELDISYPRAMQPVLRLLSLIGALVHQRGRAATTVVKQTIGERQHWRRTLRYADGQVLHFNSTWTLTANGHVLEFVNPLLGIEMAPFVVGRQLHYRGIRFVLQLGRWRLTIPQWLALGTARIVEEAVDDRHFVMDFRMVHPLFGELFRYTGTFEANARSRTDCS
jgi:hypothetical protein